MASASIRSAYRRVEVLLLLSVAIGLHVLLPSVSATYRILPEEERVSVSISATFDQGVLNPSVVSTDAFGEIPSFDSSLTGENASIIEVPLNNALKARTPSSYASLSGFSASSNGTWMQYQLDFLVNGALAIQGTSARVDLSWRSFAIAEDVKVDDVSVNTILETYLGERISVLAERRSTRVPVITEYLWYLNDRSISPSEIASTLRHLLIFNFTSLDLPLEKWTVTRSFLDQSVRLQTRTGFNLTFIGRFFEPEGTTVAFSNNAVYQVETVIDAPWEASFSGNELIIPRNPVLETQLMAGIIGAGLVMFLATLMFERRVVRTSPRRGREGHRK